MMKCNHLRWKSVILKSFSKWMAPPYILGTLKFYPSKMLQNNNAVLNPMRFPPYF